MIPAIGPQTACFFVLAFVLAVFVLAVFVLAVFVLAVFVLAVQIPYVFPFGGPRGPTGKQSSKNVGHRLRGQNILLFKFLMFFPLGAHGGPQEKQSSTSKMFPGGLSCRMAVPLPR